MREFFGAEKIGCAKELLNVIEVPEKIGDLNTSIVELNEIEALIFSGGPPFSEALKVRAHTSF